MIETHFGSSGQPLALAGRVLVGEGILTKRCRKAPKPRQFYLFNDILGKGLKQFLQISNQRISNFPCFSVWQYYYPKEKVQQATHHSFGGGQASIAGRWSSLPLRLADLHPRKELRCVRSQPPGKAGMDGSHREMRPRLAVQEWQTSCQWTCGRLGAWFWGQRVHGLQKVSIYSHQPTSKLFSFQAQKVQLKKSYILSFSTIVANVVLWSAAPAPRKSFSYLLNLPSPYECVTRATQPWPKL